MAVDKLVDSTQLNSDLTSIANAIRTKGGTSASLAFPTDFVTAINNIQTGSLVISDTTDTAGGTIRTATMQNTVSLQTKTITPTSSAQTVTPDTGYDGFSQVTVEAASGGSGWVGTITIQNQTGSNLAYYYIDEDGTFATHIHFSNNSFNIPAAAYGNKVAAMIVIQDSYNELDEIFGDSVTTVFQAYSNPYRLVWVRTQDNITAGEISVYMQY